LSIALDIPAGPRLHLETLVLDVNGTLAVDGVLLPGVRERLKRLRELVAVHLITADTHGRQADIDAALAINSVILIGDLPQALEKAQFVRSLGAARTAAIGNGANDALMLREAALGIAVLGPEGLAASALREADVVAPDIGAALDLLLYPKRLIASLRR